MIDNLPFNLQNNDDMRIKSRIAWLSGFALSASVIILHHNYNPEWFTPEPPAIKITAPAVPVYKTVYAAPMPEISESVTPPEFNPFDKKTTDIKTELTLTPRQNFASMLRTYGVSPQNIIALSSALSKYTSLNALRVGTKFNITLVTDKKFNSLSPDEYAHYLSNISFKAGTGVTLTANYDNGTYKVSEIYSPITMKSLIKKGVVTGSFYVSAQRAGIPTKMITQSIKQLGYHADFRELQRGDTFEYAFDEYYDEDNNIIGTGGLRYVSLTVSGKKHENFYLVDKNGKSELYNANGNTGGAFLMKTPIDGARVSSGYGYRRHPVLGYTKLHTGIDFAAPTGTPIYAAGDGVIAQQYFSGSYGNYIRITHNGTFATAYAHMSRFARGNRVGSSVKQGQIIGYVGTTGRSTGPHLHYEVLKNGVQINPTSTEVPVARPVTNEKKAEYQKLKMEIDARRKGQIKTVTYKSIKDIKHKITS